MGLYTIQQQQTITGQSARVQKGGGLSLPQSEQNICSGIKFMFNTESEQKICSRTNNLFGTCKESTGTCQLAEKL